MTHFGLGMNLKESVNARAIQYGSTTSGGNRVDAQQVIFAYILLGLWYLQDFIFRHWLAAILVIGISIAITIVVAARERGAKGL